MRKLVRKKVYISKFGHIYLLNQIHQTQQLTDNSRNCAKFPWGTKLEALSVPPNFQILGGTHVLAQMILLSKSGLLQNDWY